MCFSRYLCLKAKVEVEGFVGLPPLWNPLPDTLPTQWRLLSYHTRPWPRLLAKRAGGHSLRSTKFGSLRKCCKMMLSSPTHHFPSPCQDPGVLSMQDNQAVQEGSTQLLEGPEAFHRVSLKIWPLAKSNCFLTRQAGRGA